MHEQVDRYLHQCFMVGLYEPYVEVCRRLAELSPCAGGEQASLLVNSGAEAVENAVKIARAATGRPAVVVFDNALPRPHAADDGDDEQGRPVQAGFGPFAPEVYRAPAPYPYRGVATDEAIRGLELLFKRDVDPETVACVVLEPVQGEGGFIPMPHDFPRAAARDLQRARDPLRRRRGAGAASAAPGRSGRSSTTASSPTCSSPGKSLGGGLPLAGVTGRAEVMDAVAPGGLGGTFGGNPVACAAALAVLDEVADAGVPRARARSSARGCASGSTTSPTRVDAVGEVRGLGPMLALELVHDRETKEPAPDARVRRPSRTRASAGSCCSRAGSTATSSASSSRSSSRTRTRRAASRSWRSRLSTPGSARRLTPRRGRGRRRRRPARRACARRYGDVRRGRRRRPRDRARASSSRCSARRARARRRRCA